MKQKFEFYFSKFALFFGVFRKPSMMVIVFAACFAFWFFDFWTPYNSAKKGNNFVWDVFGYYSYLPATFCNGGSYDFQDVCSFLILGPDNKRLPKYTYGMSIMYAPFFALGYKVAMNSQEPLNGFSEGFANCIRWGSFFYVFLGMIFLRKFLLSYFNEIITSITLFISLFGTTLFIYTYCQSEMTHGYLFCLFSAFIYLTYKWHLDPVPKWKYTLLIGFIAGLTVLIRPTEIFILLLFLLWNIKSQGDLKLKIKLLFKNRMHLLVMACIAIALWIPQFIFWKHHTGTYFYFSYQTETFFWSDPQIFNVLFSYRKGWILYTPVIILSFLGFFTIKKEFPLSKWTFLFVTALMVYVLSCWWDWTYGGCFGARAFCQQIAYLSIPMAFLLDFIFYSEKKFILKGLLSLVTVVFIFSCLCLNLSQSYQYAYSKLHCCGISKEMYWYVFRKYHFEDDYESKYQRYARDVDAAKWIRGVDRDDEPSVQK